MKSCANCKYSYTWEYFCFCGINGREIAFPRLMGGPKKCECYERFIKEKRGFQYPKKEELK